MSSKILFTTFDEDERAAAEDEDALDDAPDTGRELMAAAAAAPPGKLGASMLARDVGALFDAPLDDADDADEESVG